MQAFFEKISKKFQRQCSRMELFPLGGGGSAALYGVVPRGAAYL